MFDHDLSLGFTDFQLGFQCFFEFFLVDFGDFKEFEICHLKFSKQDYYLFFLLCYDNEPIIREASLHFSNLVQFLSLPVHGNDPDGFSLFLDIDILLNFPFDIVNWDIVGQISI